MTLNDLLKSGIITEGIVKIQCWENECYPKIYVAGNINNVNIPENIIDRDIEYMFSSVDNYKLPHTNHTVSIAVICIELKKETKKEIQNMKNNDWVPVSSGIYPKDNEEVQVTYLGYNDNEPRCDEFAYRYEGAWYWTPDDGDVKVEITAWRASCDPYRG